MTLPRWIAVLVVAFGCSRQEAPAADGSPAVLPAAFDSGLGKADDDSDTAVMVQPEGGELRVGPNRLTIRTGVANPPPLSVDIVAPAMPSHGIVRHSIAAIDDSWIATVTVSMPGDWVLYVNFDDGSTAVAFPFTVIAPADAHAAHGAGH
jgi:hypothetical protein